VVIQCAGKRDGAALTGASGPLFANAITPNGYGPHTYEVVAKRRSAALSVAVAGLVVLSACGRTSDADARESSSPEASTPNPQQEVTGQLAIYDGKAYPARSGACDGAAAGYQDWTIGSQVSLEDQSGEVVGVGAISEGELDQRGGCLLRFSISDVRDADFYQLKSSSAQRAPMIVSRDDLVASQWHLDLELGDQDQAIVDAGVYCLDASEFSAAPLGATVGPVTVSGGITRGPVNAQVKVTSSADKNAKVLVGWEVRVWSDLLSNFRTVALASDWVTVPQGEAVNLTIHRKNADVLIDSMNYDYSRTDAKATIQMAVEDGRQADCM
jgi:hypothetical protein